MQTMLRQELMFYLLAWVITVYIVNKSFVEMGNKSILIVDFTVSMLLHFPLKFDLIYWYGSISSHVEPEQPNIKCEAISNIISLK